MLSFCDIMIDKNFSRWGRNMSLDEQIIELKTAIASKEMYERKLAEAQAEYREAFAKEKELAEILKKKREMLKDWNPSPCSTSGVQ